MKSLRFCLARVTIEARTPLTVGTGAGTGLWDSACVTDAGGLPAIPGSGIAGALRQRWTLVHGASSADGLFGYQTSEDGSPSSVQVSWAAVHGADDRPVAPRLSRSDPSRASELLTLLATGLSRDHVRIGGHGAPDGNGKFDELVVPAGARFTFELRVEGDDGLGVIRELVGYLASPSFRLGGRSRRGYGAVSLVRWSGGAFDLARSDDRARWTSLPRSLSEDFPAQALPRQASPTPVEAKDVVSGRIVLSPLDYWIFGGDTATRTAHTRDKGERVGMLPKTERRIVWPGGVGSVVAEEAAQNLVPASSVKGALRHRTLFHLLKDAKRWMEDGSPTCEETDDALAPLFGAVKRSAEGDEEEPGSPGRVFVEDAYVSTRPEKGGSDALPRDGVLDHVSLDRFTQGPMDGMLFREAPLHGGRVEVPLSVREAGDDRALRRAFAQALSDLCEGRLALGGGSNRGHGFFKGEVTGPLKDWLGKA